MSLDRIDRVEEARDAIGVPLETSDLGLGDDAEEIRRLS